MEAVLNAAIWLPLAGAVVIALLPRSVERWARWVAALVSAVVLGLSIALFVSYDPTNAGFLTVAGPVAAAGPQFVTHVPWIQPLGASYFVGLDGLSLPMFLLNALLVFLAVLISWNTTLRPREYFALVLVLETA